MKDNLSQLQRIGSDIRKKQEDNAQTERPSAETIKRKATRYSYWYTSRLAHAVSLSYASTLLFMFAAFVSYFSLAAFGISIPGVLVTIAFGGPLIALLLFPFAYIHAKHCYEKELAWLQTLPITLTNYLEVLGKKGNIFKIRVVYRKPKHQPEEHLLSDVVRGLKEKIIESDDPSLIEINYYNTVFFYGGSKKLGRFELVRVTHKLCNEVLLPLHEKYPLDLEFDSRYHTSARSY